MNEEYSFPSMPIEPEYKAIAIELFKIGCIYKTEDGGTLYVVGTSIHQVGNHECTGTISFRDKEENLIKKNEIELKELRLKRIF